MVFPTCGLAAMAIERFAPRHRKMNTARRKLVLAAALLWGASVYAAAFAPIGFGIVALIFIGVWMVWEAVGPARK